MMLIYVCICVSEIDNLASSHMVEKFNASTSKFYWPDMSQFFLAPATDDIRLLLFRYKKKIENDRILSISADVVLSSQNDFHSIDLININKA